MYAGFGEILRRLHHEELHGICPFCDSCAVIEIDEKFETRVIECVPFASSFGASNDSKS